MSEEDKIRLAIANYKSFFTKNTIDVSLLAEFKVLEGKLPMRQTWYSQTRQPPIYAILNAGNITNTWIQIVEQMCEATIDAKFSSGVS